MMEPIVCVPAHNEAERLAALLKSLQQQTWIEKNNKSLAVVLVLNNCDDTSQMVVQKAIEGLPSVSLTLLEVRFPPEQAHVGSARRLAMDRAFALAPQNSVLLTTDADARPRHDWIEANLCAIRNGADLVGGSIVGDKDEEALLGPRFVRRATRYLDYAKLVDRLASLVNPVPHDPWPRHSDHTGASLAVRGEVYGAVGGLPALPFREDVAFVERVCRAGYRLRHSLNVQVTVSARLDGRAPGGMADCLKGWLAAEVSGLPHLVEDPRAIIARLRNNQRHDAMASGVCSSAGDGIICSTWVDIEKIASTEGEKMVEIELAIGQLRGMIADLEGDTCVRETSTLDLLQRVD
jgi:GT2 family glycosyltransferase